MKAVFGHYMVQCGTCGTGMKGEQAWFESPSIIVHCQNEACIEYGNKYHLPITRLELEPYIEPEIAFLPEPVAVPRETNGQSILNDPRNRYHPRAGEPGSNE